MKRRDFIGMVAGISLSGQSGLAGSQVGLPKGYIVPAEERPHARTFMQWPNNRKVYRDTYFLDLTQQTIADIANAIADFEPVVLLADKAHHDHIRKRVSSAVELWNIPTEDLWCRDSGPLFAVHPHKGLAISNMNFNGWGQKQVHTFDGQIAQKIAQDMDVPIFDSGLQGEPGGVEQDGHGTLMAHESSWVIANRNRLTKPEIEARLLAAYGADKMIWSKGLKDQDITDYHIDGLARFAGENRVLIQLSEDPDPDDPFVKAAFETYDVLKQARGANGQPFEITRIADPISPRIKSPDFAGAYVNYYVCNGAVIAAQFGDVKTDEMAVEALRTLYPSREIITLNADVLGELGGGIHCATQQQPKV